VKPQITNWSFLAFGWLLVTPTKGQKQPKLTKNQRPKTAKGHARMRTPMSQKHLHTCTCISLLACIRECINTCEKGSKACILYRLALPLPFSSEPQDLVAGSWWETGAEDSRESRGYSAREEGAGHLCRGLLFRVCPQLSGLGDGRSEISSVGRWVISSGHDLFY
jgi:hypothetical protein